jgi:hypothetical protein
MRLANIPKIPILTGLLAGLLAAGIALAAGEEQIDDEDVTRALESELTLDQAVPSHLIDVSTSRGVVTLSGSVSNLLAKERAAEIARTMKGVRSVVNAVDVAPVPRTDPEIADKVCKALRRDPYVERHEIAVSVVGRSRRPAKSESIVHGKTVTGGSPAVGRAPNL